MPSRRRTSEDKLETQNFINPNQQVEFEDLQEISLKNKSNSSNRLTYTIIGLSIFILFIWAVSKTSYTPYDLSNKFSGTYHNNFIDYMESSISHLRTSKHCEVPYKGRPLIQYVLIIDAGSTGSRIHIYKFNYCKETAEVEDEIFIQTKPGLSSYPHKPQDAAKSLDILLDAALKNIPKELHSCTPITVKATAGLRLLGHEASSEILKEVENYIKKEYPFQIIKDEGVVIMDGKDEGVFAWVTVNYLLDNLGPDSSSKSTVATLDLGGGSTQIVFEPKFQSNYKMKEGPHKFDITFSKVKHELYQKSYLGFGLMEARKKVKDLALKIVEDGKASHPCLTIDYKEEWDVKGEKIKLIGDSRGLEECFKIVKEIFNKNKECLFESCSIDGLYQPSLDETFKDNDIFAFSYFYDRTQPFGLGEEFKLNELKLVTDKVCKNEQEYFKNIDGAIEEIRENPHRCLDLTFIYSILSYAYGIPDSRIIKLAKKINGYETGWCLGSAIAMLDDNHFCVSA